ncbi:tyrosine-protein phosphatase [Enterococcus villorum]|uniref:Tyrosine-protein phosphatase n=2 Tax=Enterococcus villorum TaxID=112904 RepID=A0A511J3E3_9ENTE|nr:CpsB/CapC family capsule biosynthesis tyrosine phosphatase [Enterococcus villorum]EOH92000.1 hypothetical protein UAO_00671 [Enterococcus villorum ATCC 700913]EOW76716.1 hypothetical protein I591_02024 [Enterococcus villorum ATCC 700913]GEL92522.1 tyrosine protein phosphatase [Enterococcus villorum]
MYCDIHNHIIFGVDDGPQTLDESIQLIQQAQTQNISHIIATPHINHRQFDTTQAGIKQNFYIVKNELEKRKIDVSLSLSQELTLSVDLFEKYPASVLIPIKDNQKNCYFLIEITTLAIPYYFEDTLNYLQQHELNCIWAHPERNLAVQSNWKIVKKIKERSNLMIQVTAGSLLGDFGKKVEKVSWKLLKKGLVDLVASDAHHVSSRPFQLDEAMALISSRVKNEAYQRIVNNMNVLKGASY